MKFDKKKRTQKVVDVACGDIFYDPCTDDYFMMIEQDRTDFEFSECICISDGGRLMFRDEQEVECVNYKLEIG